MIVGVHWFNNKKRVDLDLSVIDSDGKYGWDSFYRSSDRSILFSGDITDAPKPNGASEMFYIKNGVENPKNIYLNYFNYDNEDEIDCKFFVGNGKESDLNEHHMIDMNNVVGISSININKKQNLLGLIISVDGENRIYFSTSSIGNSISSRSNNASNHARKYMINNCLNQVDFSYLLNMAGATVVNEVPENKEFIDLSPTALNKNSILDFFTN